MRHEPRPGESRDALVAGISGTLGRTIARHLGRQAWRVRGLSRTPGEFREPQLLEDWLEGVHVEFGDLCDPVVAAKACTDVDTVVFAAGTSGVVASFSDPGRDLLGSAVPWLNVLNSCGPGDRLVLFSSQLVYGPPRTRPFRETDPLDPQSPYALHRVLMENYARLFAQRIGFEVVVLRLGNVFGEVIDPGYPRQHGVVPRMLFDLLREGTARLYGDGSQGLELLHADDVASAVLVVMQAPVRPGTLSVYNLEGQHLSVRQVADALRAGVGRGETVCVPWDSTMKRSMARDMRLSGQAFRARYRWAPAEDVDQALVRLGRSWRQATPQ